MRSPASAASMASWTNSSASSTSSGVARAPGVRRGGKAALPASRASLCDCGPNGAPSASRVRLRRSRSRAPAWSPSSDLLMASRKRSSASERSGVFTALPMAMPIHDQGCILSFYCASVPVCRVFGCAIHGLCSLKSAPKRSGPAQRLLQEAYVLQRIPGHVLEIVYHIWRPAGKRQVTKGQEALAEGDDAVTGLSFCAISTPVSGTLRGAGPA